MKNLEEMLASLGGGQGGEGSQGGQGGQEGGLAAVSKLLASNGGIQGIVSKLSQNGMGQHAQSWVGQGENHPVSGEQIQGALDPKSMHEFSQQTGMPAEQASSHVAQILPHMMDRATPQGEMPAPAEDPLSKGLDVLKRLVASASS